jgi:hypothetical protein
MDTHDRGSVRSGLRLSVVYILVALIIGFGGGTAFYALVGPAAAQVPPNVQVALVALLTASFGVAGVIVGSSISAEGTRAAASLVQAEARHSREEATTARAEARTDAEKARQEARQDAQRAREQDREDARVARFADRTRELAAQFQVEGLRTLEACGRVVAEGKVADPAEPFVRNEAFYDRGQELRLIVLPRTYQSIDRAVRAVGAAEGFAQSATPADVARLVQVTGSVSDAFDEFEDAMRIELGAAPMSQAEKLAGLGAG